MSESTFMKVTETKTELIYLINHQDIMYFTYDKKNDQAWMYLRNDVIMQIKPQALNQFKKIRKVEK